MLYYPALIMTKKVSFSTGVYISKKLDIFCPPFMKNIYPCFSILNPHFINTCIFASIYDFLISYIINSREKIISSFGLGAIHVYFSRVCWIYPSPSVHPTPGVYIIHFDNFFPLPPPSAHNYFTPTTRRRGGCKGGQMPPGPPCEIF